MSGPMPLTDEIIRRVEAQVAAAFALGKAYLVTPEIRTLERLKELREAEEC